jgi:hypothetical protein
MFNKSLLHIIFNRWTFIDLMSNLMIICASWKVMSWNFIHIMIFYAPIPWDSFNNASILLIKSNFIILYSDTHKYTFCYYWLCYWEDYNFLPCYKYQLNFSGHFNTLSYGFLLNHIMKRRFKIMSFFVQILHPRSLPNNKEVKLIYTLVLLFPFLTC